MKKIICLILLLVFALAACGETAPTDKETKPKEEYSYVVVDDYVIYDEYLGDKENVVIPDKIKGLPVKVIGEYAFAYHEAKSVIIPDTITEIKAKAFVNCPNLTTVEFGEGLEKIGTGAFQNCIVLTDVTFPQSLKEIGDNAFYLCEKITEITIPKNVENISSYAFCDTSLTSVVFENGIKQFGGHNAFYSKAEIECVEIPASVIHIEDYTFNESLKSVKFLGDAPKYISVPFSEETTIYYNKNANGWDKSVLRFRDNFIAY